MATLSSDVDVPLTLSRFDRIKRRFGTDWWHISFLLDYVLTLLILTLSYVLTRSNWIPPYHRYLPPGDPAHSYPLVPEIVPLWALLVFAFSVPYALYIAYWLFACRSLHDLHHSVLGTAESISLTVLCTQSLKVFAGEYRPNWANDNNLVDGRESFPSGHSAVAFASMTFLSLWLCARMGIFRKRNGHIWQMLLALSPYAAAGAIAVSRTRDYHHTFSDITAGALIGIGIAVFNYFLKYPPLWKNNCAEPKHRRPVLRDSMFPEL